MRTSFTLTLACTLLAALSAGAEIPQGYYDACTGKRESALKSQLYTIIKNHTRITYGDKTWKAFTHTDVDDSGSYWLDIYTFEKVSISGHSSMNIEHSFPKSWWGGIKNDAWCDIVHLMPVNQWANNDRGSYPYAEVDVEKEPNYRCPSPNYKVGSPKSGQGGGSDKVFEPADEYKGDMARTYFYMVTCYQDLNWSTNGLQTAKQGIYPTLQPWAIEMLLRWHRQDPVSEKEIKRNDGVYSQQGNRNPFIDHPEMVEHIWGNLIDKPWNPGEDPNPDPDPDPDPDPTYATLTAPIDGDVTLFATVEPGTTGSHIVPVLGSGFKSSVLAQISGPDADVYSILVGKSQLKAIALTAASINAEAGTTLTVVYTPQEETVSAPHVAYLTLSGDDLEKPVQVTLQGDCALSVEMPVVPTDADSRFFTIDGRALPQAPTQPGLYIVVTGGKAQKYLLH